MSLSTMIVGLGQIGMGYDLKKETEIYVLSHAKAFSLHPKFELVAGVDLNEKNRISFTNEYTCPAYSSTEDAVSKHRPDVVVVACPTHYHYEMVKKILEVHPPKAIVCEKPLAYNLEEARQIVLDCKNHNTQLFVNYMRCSEPGVLEVTRRIISGEIASPFKGVVWYSKGLFNNGSHFLNLLQKWLGNPLKCNIHSRGNFFSNYDFEPDFSINFEKGHVTFLAADEENYSHYTIELISASGRLRYEQAGDDIRWQSAIKDPVCDGYSILESKEHKIESQLNKSQWHVVDQLANAIENKTASICSGSEALQTIEFLSHIQGKL